MPIEENFREGDEVSQDDLSFQVMPGGEHSSPIVENPAPQIDLDSVKPSPPQPHHTNLFNNKITYIVLGILVLGALAAMAYFMLGKKEAAPEQAASAIPKVWMKKNFDVEVCLDEITCGDNADPDHDGLTNLEEYKTRMQTDPHLSDSDGDGLADGDEAHVYKTEPAAKFTSCTGNTGVACQYDDGSQISNDYDPLTPGLKMTETRKTQIENDTKAYKLHEPTTTTLTSKRATSTTTTTSKPNYVNVETGAFNPATIEIRVGDSVTWINKTTNNMELVSENLPDLHSEQLAAEKTYTYVFTKAGTFTYQNKLNTALKGTIIVQ